MALPSHLTTDYFAFYSYSNFIQLNQPEMIYDNQVVEKFQLGLHRRFFPYFYHPATLLLIWPLGYLPFGVGWVLWVSVGLLAYIAAVGHTRRSPAALLAMLVAPSTLWVALCGQSTLLAAALLFGGFRMLPRWPLLAGVLFGLLTYKPQFGVLVPVALVASGQWRAICAALVTAISFALASVAAFGWSVWATWLHDLPTIGRFMPDWIHHLAPVMVTITSNLLLFDVPWKYVHSIQSGASLTAVIVVWKCFRRSADMLSAAALAAATFLATPYAFGYDMPILTAAVVVVANERWQRSGVFQLTEIVILVMSFLLPLSVISLVFFRLSSLVILALLCLIVRRIWTHDVQTASPRVSYVLATA